MSYARQWTSACAVPICPGMLARFVSLLAALAVVVLTSVTAAHVPTASASADISGHTGETGQIAASHQHDCESQLPCASPDSAACEMLCAGILALLPQSADQSEGIQVAAIHDRTTVMTNAGRVPGLQERPPIL